MSQWFGYLMEYSTSALVFGFIHHDSQLIYWEINDVQ